MKIFETRNNGSSEKQELKKYAEQAIQFVNDCRIRSTNNVMRGGWGNSYFGQEYDTKLFALLVVGATDANSGKNFTAKHLRDILTEIIRKPCSRKEKKEMLAKKLNELNALRTDSKKDSGKIGIDRLHDFRLKPIKFESKHTEEFIRIKLAKRAIRYRLGNCAEKACVAATHLIENTRDKIGIVRVGAVKYDHQVVLISENKEQLEKATSQVTQKNKQRPAHGNYKHLFPLDTWVVDGWTRDWWQLRAWANSMCNPRQFVVRNKIRNKIESGEIALREIVHWPPKNPNCGFRIRFAHLSRLDWDTIGANNNNMNYNDFQNAVSVLQSMGSEVRNFIPSELYDMVVSNRDALPLLDSMDE